MSGIFGFTIRDGACEQPEEILGGLEYWNRIYGRDDSDTRLFDCSGIGCHIEHFSADIPRSAPIQELTGRTAVVDALLYNRDELLPMLEPAADACISDEDLLLRLIDARGWDVLELVNGDFCGAVYDHDRKCWTLFRDHLGVRPLYVYLDSRIFIFSTDIRGIASVPGVDLRVNEARLFASLTFSNPLSLQETDYRAVRCIHPGSATTVVAASDDFRVRQHLYWKPGRKKIRLANDRAYELRMRELVEDAIHRRLNAIPGLIGAELSGGLDSSVIDILINRTGRQGIYYSWSPDTQTIPMAEGADERKVIRDICSQEGIDCRFIGETDNSCASGMYDRVIPSFADTLQLSYGSRWMHAQGARVVFTGHGGDEGISHRASRFELLYNGELLSYFRLYHHDLRGRSMRLLKTLYSGIVDAFRRIHSMRSSLISAERNLEILCPEFRDRMVRSFVNVPLYYSVCPKRYVMQGGTRYRLENAAYQGASAGVRYLFPYVDHRVLDFAVSIPRRLYLTEQGNRIIYRNAFRDLMPESLAQVNYKDHPSMRDIPRKKKSEEQFRKSQEHILSRLDPKYWEGILDLEAIAARVQPDDPESEEATCFRYAGYELDRCILIQNTALMAKNWRNIDENPDLL